MALRQAKQIVAGSPVLNALDAAAGVCQVSEYLTTAALVVNDVIEMGAIAEGMIVTDCSVVTEDLDSNGTPLITLNAGILSGVYGKIDNTRTCGTEFFSASTVAQTGGLARATNGAGLLLSPSSDVVPYGIKIQAAAATLVVGGRIRMIVWMKSAPIAM